MKMRGSVVVALGVDVPISPGNLLPACIPQFESDFRQELGSIGHRTQRDAESRAVRIAGRSCV